MKTKLTETQKRRRLIAALENARQDFLSVANFVRHGQPQRASSLALESWQSCIRVLKEVDHES